LGGDEGDKGVDKGDKGVDKGVGVNVPHGRVGHTGESDTMPRPNQNLNYKQLYKINTKSY